MSKRKSNIIIVTAIINNLYFFDKFALSMFIANTHYVLLIEVYLLWHVGQFIFYVYW